MSTLHAQIREKQNILREIYGGMMTQTDLAKELGMRSDYAKEWAEQEGLAIRIGKRVRYETDMVAKRIVELRGMA